MYNNGFTRDVEILTRNIYEGRSTIYTRTRATSILKSIENRINGKEVPEYVAKRLEKTRAALDQYKKDRSGLNNLLSNLATLAAEADLP